MTNTTVIGGGMKFLLFVLYLLFVCTGSGALAQLVVFDNSHNPAGNGMYESFGYQLLSWGYTAERRTTPLMDNTDADVIVILTEDAYTDESTPYTLQEAAWLSEFVNSGKGLLASVCLNDGYWANILELMNEFGIAEDGPVINPVHYDQFAAHPLFDGVIELGDDVSQTACLAVSAPSVPVAGDGVHYMIAVYQNEAGPGAAIWTTHYYMMHYDGLGDYDNLIFLENAFAWLSRGGVADETTTWGGVKKLFD